MRTWTTRRGRADLPPATAPVHGSVAGATATMGPIGRALLAAVGVSMLFGPAAAKEQPPRRSRTKEQRAEALLARIHATWYPGFRVAAMISSIAPGPLERSNNWLPYVSFVASRGDRAVTAAPGKHAEVRELLGLGEAATRVCNRALAATKTADAEMERLAALLGLLGDRQSVPILIDALARAAKHDRGHVPYAAATWALWRLSGRKLRQTSADWKRWWQAVGGSFRLPRNRAGLRVGATQVEGLVRALANDEEVFLVRERLIVLGPGAVPHLLRTTAAASGDVQYHLAWAVDESGALAKLPAKLRYRYLCRRLGKETRDPRYWLLDKEAHRRSLTQQSYADFCRVALASGRRADRAGAEGDFRNALRGDAADLASAMGVLIEALGHRDQPIRHRAAELAGFIARFSTARPARLVDALLKRWRAEAGDYVMMGALTQFDTAAVRAAIREGLASTRVGVLVDCTRALRDLEWRPESHPAGLAERLVELTHHDSARLRQYTAEILAARLPERLAPHLERLAGDREPWTRAACALAMGKLRRPTDAKLLIELARDRESRVSAPALKVLGRPAFRHALADLALLLRTPRYAQNDPCMWAIANIGGPEAAAVLIQHAAERTTFGGTIFDALKKVTGRKFATAREAMIWWWSFPYRAVPPSAERSTARPLTALWKRLAGESLLDGYQATQAMVSCGAPAAEFLAGKLKPLRTAPGQVRRLVGDLAANDWATRAKATERLGIVGPGAEPALRAAMRTSESDELKARAKALLAACALPYPSRPGACRAARAVRVLERIGTDKGVALLKDLAGGETGDRLSTQARAALRRLSKKE